MGFPHDELETSMTGGWMNRGSWEHLAIHKQWTSGSSLANSAMAGKFSGETWGKSSATLDDPWPLCYLNPFDWFWTCMIHIFKPEHHEDCEVHPEYSLCSGSIQWPPWTYQHILRKQNLVLSWELWPLFWDGWLLDQLDTTKNPWMKHPSFCSGCPLKFGAFLDW